MPLHALRTSGARPDIEALAERLEHHLWPEPLSISLFEANGTDHWDLEALFEAVPTREALGEALAGTGFGPDALVAGGLKDQDWVRQSLEGLKPIRAGRFVVHGTHDREHLPAGAIPLLIDAGLAFGTGHHETTRGCLLALEEALRGRRPERVLDVGTGTGVLAIAAAKVLKRVIVATDNDPVAIAVARENARLNAVAPLVRTAVADGTRSAVASRLGPYDLVFANILARPLKRLSGEIASRLARSGTLVLSGILARQAAGVQAAYAARGLTPVRRIQLGDWTTLVMKG